MRKIEKLLDLAKQGLLSKKQAEIVAMTLQNPQEKDNQYTLLYILGKGGFIEYRDLIESFLISDKDPNLAKLSLQILCSFWNESARYKDHVLKFLKGVSWDVDSDCKLIAISIAGHYLSIENNTEISQELFRIFDDKNESHLLREAAYISMMRAIGLNRNQVPSVAKEFDLLRDVNVEMINKFKRELAKI